MLFIVFVRSVLGCWLVCFSVAGLGGFVGLFSCLLCLVFATV